MCTYIFFHLETFDLLFLIDILPTMGRIYNVVDQNKYVKKSFIGFWDSHDGIVPGSVEVFSRVVKHA